MKKLFALLAFLAALFAAPVAFAQASTLVTGTVTDPGGIPYAYGTIKAQITPSVGSPCVVTHGNCVPIQGTVGPTPMSANGSFTMNLYPNASIVPSGTQWLFTVCISPGAAPPVGTGPQCFSSTQTISGSSQSLTSALSALAPALSYLVTGANLLASNNTWTGVNTYTQTINGSISGNAATATTATTATTAGALSATPTQCTGSPQPFATGIAANGNANCSTPASNPQLPTILANYQQTLGSDIALTANTLTNVVQQAVTMPSTGCPCRAITSYALNWFSGSNNGSANAAVSDGTNTFASSQAIWPATNNTGGEDGFQISPVTYANSQVVTFTLEVETNQGGNTVKAAPLIFGQNSRLGISIVTSQIDGLDQFATFNVAAATAFPIGPLTPASLSEEPIALVVGDDGGGLPTVNAGSGATSALGTSMGGGNILTAAIASPITVNATATTSVNMAAVLALLKLNGTFTIVQHPTPINTTGTSTALAFGSNLTAGNTVIAFLWASGAAGSSSSASITDTQGNFYQQIGTIYEPSGGSHSAIQATMFLATNVHGGADTLTFKTGSSFTYGTITEMEVSGVQP